MLILTPRAGITDDRWRCHGHRDGRQGRSITHRSERHQRHDLPGEGIYERIMHEQPHVRKQDPLETIHRFCWSGMPLYHQLSFSISNLARRQD
jgi:hypothetical protein